MKPYNSNDIALCQCPFCGEIPNGISQDMDLSFYVAYENKSCYVTPITKGFKLKIDAIRAWNIRSSQKPIF